MSAYSAPAGESWAEIREKGSVFLARDRPGRQRGGGEERRSRTSPGAIPTPRHHCWAWRLGSPPRERSSDAGEPAGTAGVPILQVLRGAGLSDVLAVVVRWFGGTKLGKGGLARAYAGAAREALAGLAVAARVPTARVELRVPYERVGAVKRLIHPPEVELESEEYGEQARLVLAVHEGRAAALREALADLGVRDGGI